MIVPYDPTLIPDGMTAEDVHTWFYNPALQKWEQLPRTAIDVGDHVTHSATMHFTIMIDAVLAVPKDPTPRSFDPTTLSSIAAASPAANIDLVAPPQANSSGDARLSLPIRVPQGRGAYTPSLAIAYSSAAEDGWLGVGWDLATSKIEIDTRWGVPTYRPDEEPRYVLDGAELVPTLDADGPSCTDGSPGRRYHTRIEGAFAHILRCGSSAASYHWEVRDRNGTLFVFGASADANQARLDSYDANHPGTFRWALASVTDVHGNTTTFHYRLDEDTSSAEPSRELYPSEIDYTSGGGQSAAYSVTFDLDDGSRPDRIISGRAGFKTVMRHLLRAVHVRYRGSVIRDYVLTYAHGQYDKTVLASIKVYGVGGCAPGGNAFVAPACSAANFLDEHTFDYSRDETGFAPPVELFVDGPLAAQKMPLSAGAASTTSGGLSATVGIVGGVSATLGGNVATGGRDELIGMYDMNGDGLPDQVYTDGTRVYVLYNQSQPGVDPTTHPLFAPDPSRQLVGLSAMGHESHQTWGIDASVQADFGAGNASVGAGFSSSTSRASRILMDLDGDGFTDYLAASPKIARPCAQGMCFQDASYGAVDRVDPHQDPVLAALAGDITQRLILGDPVVQWTAPFSGHIAVQATAIKPSSGGVDGVTVELYRGDALLDSTAIGPTDTGVHTLADATGLDVNAGDTLYLRVKTGSDDGIAPDGTLLDRVSARLAVQYATVCAGSGGCSPIATPGARDPAGASLYAFDSQADFRVAGTPSFVVAPVTGTLELHGILNVETRAADVRACVLVFPPASPGFAPNFDTRCDATGTDAANVSGTISIPAGSATDQPIDVSISVAQGQIAMLRVESDFSFDPAAVSFRPKAPGQPFVSYSQVCLPNDSGGQDCGTDAAQLAAVKLPTRASTDFGPYIALQPSPSSPVVAPSDTTMHVSPIAPGDDSILVIRSDRQGVIEKFDCRSIACGTIVIAPFPVAAGEAVYFEVASASGSAGTSTVHGTMDGSGAFTAPLTAHSFAPSEPLLTPFAGGYHGWRAGIWNEAQAFAPNELLSDYQDLAAQDQARQVEILRSAIEPQPSFGRDPSLGLEPGWIGASSVAFITSSGGNAGYVGLFADGASTADRGGLFTAGFARISGTSSEYITLGASVGKLVDARALFGVDFSVEASTSETDSSTDVMDLDGDGVADVLAGSNLYRGTLTTSAGPTDVPNFGPDAPLRTRKGFDYSVGLGGTAVVPVTSSSGRTLAEAEQTPQGGSLGSSHNVGLAIGRSETRDDLVDVNGDGLPDLVHRRGPAITVQLNLGSHFGAAEPFGAVDASLLPSNFAIDKFETAESSAGGLLDTTSDALDHDTTITKLTTNSLNLVLYSSSTTTRQTTSRVTRQVLDLNGDGLPDLLVKKDGAPIEVQFNLGGTFGPAMAWDAPAWGVELSNLFDDRLIKLGVTGPDVLAGTGSETSVSSNQSISIPIPFTPITVGGHLGNSTDIDTYELAILDVNGDGMPDHVLRRTTVGGTPTIYVEYNRATGLANLLATVHRPLGSTVTLGYTRVGNTVDLPRSRQVLTQVAVDDGVDLGASFESPTVATDISYAGGFFSRDEKELFGFAQVTTKRADGVTVEDEYENRTFPLHGRLLSETRRDSAGRLFHQHVLTYDVRTVLGPDEAPLAVDPSCIAHLPPLLGPDACTSLFPVIVRDDDTRAEGGPATKTRTVEDQSFDRFGNELATLDHGDATIAADDLYAEANYQNDTSQWILGRATSLIVRAGGASGAILRARTGQYDAFGQPSEIDVETGSGTATTHLAYDAFGNLAQLTTPPNDAGQPQTYSLTYDPDVETYPASITDGFGDTSTTTYDVRFGIATHEIDIHGASLTRTLDAFGRLTAVAGPYDTAGPGITLEYHPEESPPRAVSTMRASAPPDYTGPVPPPLTTVTIADGLGRAIELRKTAVVDGVAGMTTSGLVARDAMGRVVRTQNPFFTPGASTSFASPEVTLGTTMAYDALDRPISTVYPDGATESASFDVAADPDGALLFLTRTVDPNGHARESYIDQLGRTRAFVEHPADSTASITRYDYLATGELSHITDAEGNQTALAYDLRGLRTALDNPDDGLIEDQYDLMGNRVAMVDPDHRALGSAIHYLYDRDRLVGIDYPSKPDVTFTYGAPGAAHFGAGRVVQVTDETGTRTHEYGALGELRRTVRTFVDPAHEVGSAVFDLRMTTDSFGRQLQVGYPDGELVTNTYDAAGMLSAVAGAGDGWSRTYVSDLRYDVFGNRTRALYGNGDTSTWTFDPARIRLTSLVTTLASSAKVQDLHYTYDPASNPIAIANNLPASPVNNTLPGTTAQTFTYDGVDRLLSATGSGTLGSHKATTYSEVFAYSASHNLLHKTSVDQVISINGSISLPGGTNYDSAYTYATERPHLPTQIGDLAVAYDPSGNPVTRTQGGSAEHLVWDDDNRLVQVTGTGANQRNVFDAAGLRVLRHGRGDTIFASPYFEFDAVKTGTKHVFAGAMRVATVLAPFTSGASPQLPTKRGTAFFLHENHLGSTAVVTTEDDQVNDAHEYFPDGADWIDSGKTNSVDNYLFSGKPFDPDTGFYDFGQRFYDPRTSLWLGNDPAFRNKPRGAIAQASLVSPIGFDAENPLRFVDPDGRCPVIAAFGGECLLYDAVGLSSNSLAANAAVSQAGLQTVNSVTNPTKYGERAGAALARARSAASKGDLVGAFQGITEAQSEIEAGVTITALPLLFGGEPTEPVLSDPNLGAAGRAGAAPAGVAKAVGGGEVDALANDTAGGAAKAAEQGWKLGGFKSAAKWESQMAKRGWTPEQITEALEKGKTFGAENLVNKGNAATRYVHPGTDRSVVIDDVTKEVIHVGGEGFKY